MPSVWVQRREKRQGVRYRVLFRLGGRESAIQHAGSFRTMREARFAATGSPASWRRCGCRISSA